MRKDKIKIASIAFLLVIIYFTFPPILKTTLPLRIRTFTETVFISLSLFFYWILIPICITEEGETLRSVGFKKITLRRYLTFSFLSLFGAFIIYSLLGEIPKIELTKGYPLPLFFHSLALQLSLVALPEEVFFRGYLISRLKNIWPPFLTLLFTALVFGLVHLILNPLSVIPAFFCGLLWGWVYLRTESILPSVTAHILINLLT